VLVGGTLVGEGVAVKASGSMVALGTTVGVRLAVALGV
jgi:hypothetical protein